MYVVHFVSMRGLQAPYVRLSGHASCFALRLCHLLHLPSSDLAESEMRFIWSCNACSAIERRHVEFSRVPLGTLF